MVYFKTMLLRTLLCLSACVAFAPAAHAGSKEETKPVNSNITPLELDAIHDVFVRLAEAFKKGDADACMKLFVQRAQRPKTLQNLQREFAQVRYTTFEILSVTPDETIPPKRQSVDVAIRRTIERIGGTSTASETTSADADSTIDTFYLQRQDDNSFLLLESPFFDKLGQRRGIGLIVDGLLGLMAVFALMVFWVWMGFDAYRIRPRATVWRVLVIVPPLLGAVLYCLIRYLPRKIRGEPEKLTEGLR